MKTARLARHARGVSIVEALVALAVMAFGMLGVVGLQAAMRYNADIAKQRSEAVRIAQERIEQARGYIALAGADSFASIADVSLPQTVTDYTTNTTYTWTASVPMAQTDPPLKMYEVRVTWSDRNEQTQEVVLRTNIAGVAPELAGSLGSAAAGLPEGYVRDRNVRIPSSAVPQGDGTSRFTPPGGSVGWVFNNTSGMITQVCNVLFTECTLTNRLLLSGFVRFHLLPPFDSENPRSFAPFTVDLRVNLTQPTSPSSVDCFTDFQPVYVAYFCAMPLTEGVNPKWSGTPELSGFAIANDDDDEDDRYRVCRYTPVDSDSATVRNVDHPRTYTNVTTALVNQNYLIIPAGNDHGTRYACPDDGPSDALNTNTWQHQPQPAG